MPGGRTWLHEHGPQRVTVSLLHGAAWCPALWWCACKRQDSTEAAPLLAKAVPKQLGSASLAVSGPA